MMAALEFRFVFNLMHHMTRHVKLAGDNPETRDCRRPLVCFLACTTDAASANFLLVSHLMWSASPSFLHAYLLLVLLLVMLLLLLPLSPLLRHCGCCLPPAPTAVADAAIAVPAMSAAAAAAAAAGGAAAGGGGGGGDAVPRLCQELTAISHCVLYVVVHSICLAHAISLCARSAYVCIGGSPGAGGKLFVSGLLAASHVFSKTSYMVKICRGATNVAMATRTLEPDEASLQGSVATQVFMCGVSFAVSRSGPRPRPQNIRRYVKSLLVCVSVTVSISIIVT